MAPHKYLLDTNILSDLIKHPAGAAAKIIAALEGEKNCCTSVIVACELRYGALKKNSSSLTDRVNQLLDSVAVLSLEADVESEYAALRVSLEQAGTSIGSNDLLIASHALAADLTLVTANEREFSRVPGLNMENWLR